MGWFFFASENVQRISDAFAKASKLAGGQGSRKRKGKENTSLQVEKQKEAELIKKEIGWYTLAVEVAKYCNTDFFTIMNKPADEIAAISWVMAMQIKMNNLTEN